MTKVFFFLILLLAMFAWFGYVAWRDPAGIFKPRPRLPADGDAPD